MNSTKIIYVNHSLLDQQIIQPVLKNYPNHNWQALHQTTNLYKDKSTYPRCGVNNFPLDNQALLNIPGIKMPVYDPNFCLSFEKVTDQQITQLWNKNNDRPWLIFWSGGIDSTVILASILKNIPPADFARIHVACDRISVYENPRFFYEYIQPNFKLVNSSGLRLSAELLEKYYVVDGEPGDQLCMPDCALDMLFSSNDHLRNFRTDSSGLISYLEHKVNKPWAEWYYTRIVKNIDSLNIPIETYHDFLWWTCFNYSWTDVEIAPMEFLLEHDCNLNKLYFKNSIHWYDSAEYQQWSMNNNQPGVKFGKHIGEFKLAFKQYIYDIDHNEYYYNFKLKCNSVSRQTNNLNLGWFCLLNDYTVLTLDHDLEQIIDLLPAHIQN